LEVKVYVKDEYCRALGFTSGYAYEVTEHVNGGGVSYYRIRKGPNDEKLIYAHWCYKTPPVIEFEFPKGLFEI